MKQKFLLLSIAFVLLTVPAFSQTTHYPRLEVKEKQTFEVGPGNILIADTLIMHDKSTIKFLAETSGLLLAKVVMIGDNCIISSRGENGSNHKPGAYGTPGQNGGDLEINIHIEQLGSLTIDSRGGRGGDGAKGRDGAKGEPDRYETRQVKGPDGKFITQTVYIPGTKGSDGTNATTGLNGGNGGNIDFTYSTNGFIPVFNHSKSNQSITLLHTAGDAGRDGIPGRGGLSSMDGQLIQLNVLQSVDGQLKLTNKNNTSSVQEHY